MGSYKGVVMNKSCCCDECGKNSIKQLKFDGIYETTKTRMFIKRKKLKLIFHSAVQALIGANRLKLIAAR